MSEHKFLTPKLASALVLAKIGVASTNPVGFIVAWLVERVVNALENAGLRVINIVVVSFANEKDRREWDAAQEIALTIDVSRLTQKEKDEKSKGFRATFRKLANFGFLRNK